MPSGTMVVSMRSADDRTVYRIIGKSGQSLSDDTFDAFTNLGCSFLRVRLGETWYSIKHDGSLTTQMFYPFSC